MEGMKEAHRPLFKDAAAPCQSEDHGGRRCGQVRVSGLARTSYRLPRPPVACGLEPLVGGQRRTASTGDHACARSRRRVTLQLHATGVRALSPATRRGDPVQPTGVLAPKRLHLEGGGGP